MYIMKKSATVMKWTASEKLLSKCSNCITFSCFIRFLFCLNKSGPHNKTISHLCDPGKYV